MPTDALNHALLNHSQCPHLENPDASRFADIPRECCYGADSEHCICSTEEASLRRYAAGHDLRPMSPKEVEWCIEEADRCGEGYYSATELEAMSHRELANAVLNAWHMYVQSNCL